MTGIELEKVKTATLDPRWHRVSRDFPRWFNNRLEAQLEDQVLRLEGVGSAYSQGRRLMVRVDDEKAIPKIVNVVTYAFVVPALN